MPRYDVGKLFDELSEKVVDFWQPKVASYVNSSGLELTYSKRELGKTLDWIIKNGWRLELANADFGFIYSTEGNWGVLRELQTIAKLIWDYAQWYIEQDFGYAESIEDMASNARARNPAEEMARALIEPFERAKDNLYRQMEVARAGLRESEFAKSKAVARQFIRDVELWVISKAGLYRTS